MSLTISILTVIFKRNDAEIQMIDRNHMEFINDLAILTSSPTSIRSLQIVNMMSIFRNQVQSFSKLV